MPRPKKPLSVTRENRANPKTGRKELYAFVLQDRVAGEGPYFTVQEYGSAVSASNAAHAELEKRAALYKKRGDTDPLTTAEISAANEFREALAESGLSPSRAFSIALAATGVPEVEPEKVIETGIEALSARSDTGLPIRDLLSKVAQAARQLRSYGVPFEVALKGAVDRAELDARSISVKKLVLDYLSSREKVGRSGKYTDDTYGFDRLVEGFGDRKADTLHPTEVRRWLEELQGLRGKPLAADTRNGIMNRVRAVFNWGFDSGLIKTNPGTGLEAFSGPRSNRSRALTPKEVEDLLRAVDHSLVPALVVGVFCGLRWESDILARHKNRRGEYCPLLWDDIELDAKKITIPCNKAGGEPRRVPMEDAAVAWLDWWDGPKTGRVAPTAELAEDLRLAAWRKVSTKPWPPNALRRSFASYHVALYEDPPTTAYRMAHEGDISTLEKWYRKDVGRDGAEKLFWEIRP